jgi:hypothetical protein
LIAALAEKFMSQEKRYARDGIAYTKEEFEAYYSAAASFFWSQAQLVHVSEQSELPRHHADMTASNDQHSVEQQYTDVDAARIQWLRETTMEVLNCVPRTLSDGAPQPAPQPVDIPPPNAVPHRDVLHATGDAREHVPFTEDSRIDPEDPRIDPEDSRIDPEDSRIDPEMWDNMSPEEKEEFLFQFLVAIGAHD